MAVFLALIIALIPLIIAPGIFFYFDVTPKTFLILAGSATAAVWWAWKGEGAGFYRSSRAARLFVWSVCGMGISLAVSTLFSVRPALSLGGSTWRYWGLVTQLAALAFAGLVAMHCAGRPARLELLLRAISISGLIVALYGIAQYFGWDPFLDPRGYHVGEGIWSIVRPPSTLGHADYSANWLLFVVFAALASNEAGVWRWLSWAAAAVASVAIVFSGTRAALLGLAVGAFMWLFSARQTTGRRRSPWIIPLLALAIGVTGLLFYLSPAGTKLRARVHWSLDEPAGGARLLLWRDTFRMAESRLLTGYGPETFISTFALHQSPELSRAYPDFYHESPHNILLDALVSQGIAGPAFLLLLVASGFYAFWCVRRNPTAAALAAGLAAMILSAQFTSFILPTALACYVTVAMLVSLSIAAPLAQPARRWPALAAAASFAAVLVFFAVRLALSETALAAVRRDLDANLVTEASSQYTEYERWRWPNSSADLWYSRRLAQIAATNALQDVREQAFQQAGLAAERAPQSTEAPFNAYYNLAAFYARTNDFFRTEQSLRAAIFNAPNWFKTHWMLAQVLQAAGRMPEAETEAAKAVSLDGGKHAEVSATLDRIRRTSKLLPESLGHPRGIH